MRPCLKHFVFFCLAALSSCAIFSQSKKQIKTYKIKSVTEYNVTTTGNVKENYKAFDKNANTIEDVRYNPDGSIRQKEIFKYDKLGNKLEESLYEQKKSLPDPERNYKRVSKYNGNNDKIEEIEYDGDGKVVKKEVYTYNANGDKVTEITYDALSIIRKKGVYSYDNKGLKTEKKIYGPSGALDQTKKFEYAFN